jgi:hypothetical protein
VSYIVESGASTSRRARRRRTLLTLAIVLLMLFFAFWYAYSYYRASGEPRAAAPTTTCTNTAAATPKPSTTTVNVYNATQRNGLAGKTASEVRKRGFKVATVSNDPLQKKVAGAAEVRFGKAGAQASKLVLELVKGARAVQDGRTDASVDLVLGDAFRALAPAPRPSPTTPTSSSTC